MKCAWQEFLSLLPLHYRTDADRLGKSELWELRMRTGHPPEGVGAWGRKPFGDPVQPQDLRYVINSASRYSPWAAQTITEGYLTASGGHRIGISGKAVMQNDQLTAIKDPVSLCIRIARDHPGIAKGLPLEESVLIIGKPGAGKTTLLRDLIRQRAVKGSVSVVDERGELFPDGIFCTAPGTDILCGCPKKFGIEMMLRTMGPAVIAVDEITADSDCDAMVHAGWCGVDLLATAHASDRQALFTRPVYQRLLETRLFQWLVILQRDKSWRLERM